MADRLLKMRMMAASAGAAAIRIARRPMINARTGTHVRSPAAAAEREVNKAEHQSRGDWLKIRTEQAQHIGQDLDKSWPILDKIASVPGNENTLKKARHALQVLDRMLDVFEPGQIALSFNGGKDSTVLMLLLKEACDLHPSHSFTHVQPIWFQNPLHEFPEMVRNK